MNTRRVLLLGAAGQVGVACQRTRPSDVELHSYSHAELDISDLGQVRSVIDQVRPTVVINCAAFTAVDKAESESDDARRANVLGPANIAVALSPHGGARLIHISTDFVFDGRASVPYSPDSPTGPLGVYGATKLEGEHAVIDTLGDRVTIVRSAWLYSATGNNFLRTMLRLMARGPVRVVTDQVGTPTSAKSLAEVLWRISTVDVGGVFHWSDAGVASWYDFAVAIVEEAVEAGVLAELVDVTPIASYEYPTPAKRPHYSVLDKSATIRQFGVVPVHWRRRLREEIGEIRGA